MFFLILHIYYEVLHLHYLSLAPSLKKYRSKWHNFISPECQIFILRVRGPKWYLGTSSRDTGVLNSISKYVYTSITSVPCYGYNIIKYYIILPTLCAFTPCTLMINILISIFYFLFYSVEI